MINHVFSTYKTIRKKGVLKSRFTLVFFLLCDSIISYLIKRGSPIFLGIHAPKIEIGGTGLDIIVQFGIFLVHQV